VLAHRIVVAGVYEPYSSKSHEPGARVLRLKSLQAVGSVSDNLSVAIVIIIVRDAPFVEGAASTSYTNIQIS
jgi:hypothetical protein